MQPGRRPQRPHPRWRTSSLLSQLSGDVQTLDLAGGRARNGGDDVKLLGSLEIGETLAAMRDQFRFGNGFAEDYGGGNFLAPGGMWDAERYCFGDGGMREQYFVNFARSDFLAAAVDHLFEASGELQIAFGVERALIAGAEPASHKRFGVGFRIVFVGMDHARSLNDHFALAARRQQIAGFVHDPDADSGGRAYAAELVRGRRQRIGRHLVRGFGHAVSFEHWRAE